MKRKECFFGLHFDYHSNENTPDVGKFFDEKILERIIKEVKPDFIQCDTKGHPGYSSYNTKVGNAAPNLATDLLKKWREVTAKYGVLLFSHYSGLWDKKVAKDHPDWTIKNAEGEPTEKMSVFGKYADNLLIPQLIELAIDYKMNGAWVDGECWALEKDYSDKAKKACEDLTGKDLNGLMEDEEKEFLAANREGFFAYVKNYIEQVKKVAPDFEITSNWLNTSWVPDNVCITDFISGDLAPTDSVDSARFDGRIMQSFNRPWDIMSWGISFPVHYVKSAVQLKQEASVVLSLGGGFQIYNMQSPQETVVDEWAIPIWADVADFCGARKEYCHGSSVIPDLGILYSVKSYYDCINVPFCRNCEYNMELNGLMLAFLDMGISVSVVHAEKDSERLKEYKTIVVSNLTVLESGLKEKLLESTSDGGQLILCGTDTIKMFAEDLNLSILPSTENTEVVLHGTDYSFEVRKPYLKIKGATLKTVLKMTVCELKGDLNCTNPPPAVIKTNERIPAFSEMDYGKGKISLMPINLGRYYYESNTYEIKKFFTETCDRRIDYKVRVNKPFEVEVNITKKGDKDYVHLINLLGEHRSERIKTFDKIPKVNGIEVEYKADKKPKQITLQPNGKDLPFRYEGNSVFVYLEELEIYSILEICY